MNWRNAACYIYASMHLLNYRVEMLKNKIHNTEVDLKDNFIFSDIIIIFKKYHVGMV